MFCTKTSTNNHLDSILISLLSSLAKPYNPYAFIQPYMFTFSFLSFLPETINITVQYIFVGQSVCETEIIKFDYVN